MWLMLTTGFYSIVAKPGDTRLTVRSRVRADLERLKSYFPIGPIRENAGTDYRYRAHITRAAFADGLATVGADIDYDNFKNEVTRKLGPQRAATYHRVWSVLLHELHDDPPTRNLPLVTDVPTPPRPRRGRHRR